MKYFLPSKVCNVAQVSSGIYDVKLNSFKNSLFYCFLFLCTIGELNKSNPDIRNIEIYSLFHKTF